MIGWQKFRKRPVVIEAVRWTGVNVDEIRKFTEGKADIEDRRYPQRYIKITIHTLEGDHTVSEGDWVIKGVANEFYPIKNEIFIKTYEKVL